MRYLVKTCKRCGVKFNTRPFYSKNWCKKCWNAIRMKVEYHKVHPIGRVLYVSGNPTESKKQWARRNKEKRKEVVFNYRYKKGGVLKDKEWKEKNLEKIKGYRRKFQNNPVNKEKKTD